MRAHGVKKGDRVAVVASTSFDTFITFMAVVSLGGLFSSSSTDMGTKGILERLLQIKPAYVFVDDWTVYNGKTIDLRPKIRDIVKGMEGVQEFRGVVSQPRFPGKPAGLEGLPRTVSLDAFLEAAKGNAVLDFERVAFRDPFLIVYSSGTTGVPKCIVHSTGGVLISVIKEGLHHETAPDSVVLQYTTVCTPRHKSEQTLTEPDRLDHVPRLSPMLPRRRPIHPLRRLTLHALRANLPLHPRTAARNRFRHLTALPPGAPKTRYRPQDAPRPVFAPLGLHNRHGPLRRAVRMVLRHRLPVDRAPAQHLRRNRPCRLLRHREPPRARLRRRVSGPLHRHAARGLRQHHRERTGRARSARRARRTRRYRVVP